LKFHLWGQVTYLWNSGASPGDLLLHPHGMRYFLVLPYFKLADWFNISYNWVFSISIPMLILIITTLIVRAVGKINGGLSANNVCMLIVAVSVFFMILSLFMNGRIMFSITGSAILIYLFVVWNEKNFFGILFLSLAAIFLTSVSSGTLLVSVLSFYIVLIVKCFKFSERINKKQRIKNLKIFFVFAGLFLLAFPLIEIIVMKNVNFYGGGFDGAINMLSHGIGAILLNIEMDLLVLIIFNSVLAFLLLLMLFLCYRRMLAPMYLIGVSVAGGLFGVSTIIMLLPPLMVLACYMALKTGKVIT
jgi:hypothetical protein